MDDDQLPILLMRKKQIWILTTQNLLFMDEKKSFIMNERSFHIHIKDNSKFMKIWGGRICHVLDHITWYNLPMMIIRSYLRPNCVYWTWMFFFNCLKCHPTQTLLSWNGLTPDNYVGCIVQLVTMGLAATLLHMMGRYLIIPCYINIYTSSMFQFITQFLNGLPSLAFFLLSRKLNFQIFKKFKHNKIPCTISSLWGCNFLPTYR
jgi:hypothetical protein